MKHNLSVLFLLFVYTVFLSSQAIAQDVPLSLSISEILPNYKNLKVATDEPGLVQLISIAKNNTDSHKTYSFHGDKDDVTGVVFDQYIEKIDEFSVALVKLQMLAFIENFTFGKPLPDRINTINAIFKKMVNSKNQNIFINDDSLGNRTLVCTISTHLEAEGIISISLSVYIHNSNS